MAEVLLELPEDLKSKAKAEADRLTLSLNAWIRLLLIQALQEPKSDPTLEMRRLSKPRANSY